MTSTIKTKINNVIRLDKVYNKTKDSLNIQMDDESINILCHILDDKKIKYNKSSLATIINYGNYHKNEIIVKEDDLWLDFCVIINGEISVSNKKRGVIGILKKGDWFGNLYDTINSHQAMGTLKSETNTKIIKIPSNLVSNLKHINNYYHINSLDDILFIPDKIGDGAFADIYKCKINENRYAIKCIKKQHINENNSSKQLLNEISVLKEIKHPQVLEYINVLQDVSNIYIVTELILHGDLFNYIVDKQLDEPSVQFYSCNIIIILEYLHNINIIYRDLKPENIIFMPNGYLKLIDFGFAKKLTIYQKTYTILGTPDYIAPEILTSNGYNRYVDYWSLGILIYELCYCSTPFGNNIYNIIQNCRKGIDFPNKSFSDNSKQIIELLLNEDMTRRLGYNNINEIKNHKWFLENHIDWVEIENQSYKPRYIPKKNRFNSLYVNYNEINN